MVQASGIQTQEEEAHGIGIRLDAFQMEGRNLGGNQLFTNC